jgi:hypothetical protein
MGDRETHFPQLAETHRAWLQELSERLSTVCSPEADDWDRSIAVRYLEEEFVPRFRREARAIDAAAQGPPAVETMRVWAVTELLKLLRVQLIQLFHSAEGGVGFARLTAKLLRAFECWCNEVEAVVTAVPAEGIGPMSNSSDSLQQRFMAHMR